MEVGDGLGKDEAVTNEPLAALRALSRRFTPLAWSTPADLAGLRDALAATLTTGAPFRAEFRYPDIDVPEIESLALAARAASDSIEGPLRGRVLDEIEETIALTRLLASRDDAALAAHQDAPARRPTPETVAEAQRIIATVPRQPDAEASTMDAGTLASDIEAVLGRYGLADWTVELHPNMAARASVMGSRRLVKVRADVAATDAERDRLLAHEVGGHVLRWVNASEQAEPLAGVPLGETVATEEGNAASVEEELGVSSPAQLRTYALRVLAVDEGRRRGLVDLARFLGEHLDPEDAAALALRVRRGFVDPDAVGARSKDHGYLSGLLALRRLRAEAPEDLALLRVTKWPLGWLPLMRELRDAGRLCAPRLVADPVLLLGRPYRRAGVVEAQPLDAARAWTTSGGTPMRSRAGDWWVTDAAGPGGADAVAPAGQDAGRGVAASEFDRLYTPVVDGRFERAGEVLAVQARVPHAVVSLEGPDVAHPGDWIVQEGPVTHRWVVPDASFRASYRHD